MLRRKGFENELGMFGSCFLKLFLRTVFENIKNTKILLFENFSYSLNLVFLCFLCFLEKKKL